MELQVFKTDGSPSSAKVELSPAVFEIEPNESAIYHAVRVEMANRRRGSRATKSRSDTRGGGRKPWRQKGTGRARAGSRRSPIWVGGGHTFAIRPGVPALSINRRVKRLARRSALSTQAKQDRITVIDDLSIEEPRTNAIVAMLRNMGFEKSKVLLLVAEPKEAVVKSCRNIPRLHLDRAADASTYDILDCDRVIIEESAVSEISAALDKKAHRRLAA